MTRKHVLTLFLAVLSAWPGLQAQEVAPAIHPFELRPAWEWNRRSLAGTLGYSFVQAPDGAVRVELGALGVPLFGVSGSYLFLVAHDIRLGGEAGMALSPVVMPVAACPSVGLVGSYAVSSSADVLFGCRVLFVPGARGQSIGTSDRMLDLQMFPPAVVFVGYAF